jgi:hypothetical protein
VNPKRAATALLVTTIIGGLVVLAIPTVQELFRPTLYKKIPTVVLDNHSELKAAHRDYVKKGNEYIWGSNDCSVFVWDYLKASGKNPPSRPTTATMAHTDFLAQIGYKPTQKPYLPGDIIVYRYTNRKGEPAGHTGIITNFDHRLFVVHNSAAHDGVIMEALPNFVKTAVRLSKSQDYKVFRRDDAKSWLRKSS